MVHPQINAGDDPGYPSIPVKREQQDWNNEMEKVNSIRENLPKLM